MKEVSEYLALITSQYQRSVNFLAWLTRPLEMLYDIDMLSDSMPDYFDLDKAVGVQLDMIGSILGQSRYLNFNPTDGTDPYLPDELYRSILRFKVGVNSWDGQVDSIYVLWAQLFPNSILTIVDNQNMSCTVTFTGSLPQIVVDMIARDLLLPRPEGVRYDYIGLGSVAILPFFAYDIDDTYFTGYDYGYWDVSSAGKFGEPPLMTSAMTDVTGTIITMAFSKDMIVQAYQYDEFSVNVGLSPIIHPSVASININPYDNTKIDLYLVTSPPPIAWGNIVTLNYSGDVQSLDGNILSAFVNKHVTLTMPEPPEPVLLSAETSTDGLAITLTFDKAMADPTGNQIYFDVEVNNVPFSVSVCSTGSSITEIVLTLTTAIYLNAIVTVGYAPGTVTASDGGILGIISGFSVTNNSTVGINLSTFLSGSGADDGGYTLSTDSYYSIGTYVIVGNTGGDNAQHFSCYRFPNINIPKNATIISAKMRLTAQGSYSGAITGPIYGNAADNAVAPITGTDFDALLNTVSVVHWDTPNPIVALSVYDTPDLTSIVQEIISRSGWNSGNAVQFMCEVVSGAVIKSFYAYDYGSPLGTDAPELIITYYATHPPTLQSAWTSVDGKKIFLSFDKVIADPVGNQSYFVVKVGISANNVTACALDTTWLGSTKVISLALTTAINMGDIVLVSYSGGTVGAGDGGILGSIVNFSVVNNAGSHGTGSSIFYPADGTDDGYAVDVGYPTGGGMSTTGTVDFFGDPYPGSSSMYSYACRFRNVNIPQGATITSAKVSFYANSNASNGYDTVNVRVTAHAVDSGTFPAGELELRDNPRTFNYLDWNAIDHWANQTWNDSPDILNIIQEIINRPGWVPGNNITIFVMHNRCTHGTRALRNFYSYDNGSYYPKLTVTWEY